MNCPLCHSSEVRSSRIITHENGFQREIGLCRCQQCTLAFLEDYEKDRSHIYNDKYAAWHKSNHNNAGLITQSKVVSFRKQLRNLYRVEESFKGRKILDIGTGNGYLLDEAKQMGFDCYGLDISAYSVDIASKKFPNRIHLGSIFDGSYDDSFFDVVTMTDLIEHVPCPINLFEQVNRILKPGGYLFIITPNYDSITRRILGKNWFQYKYEHVLYFNRRSLDFLLNKYNFEMKIFDNNIKYFSLAYYYYYFKKYSFLGIGVLLSWIFPVIPQFVTSYCFPNQITGEFLAISKKKS